MLTLHHRQNLLPPPETAPGPTSPPLNGPPPNGPPLIGPPLNGPPLNGPPQNNPPANVPPEPAPPPSPPPPPKPRQRFDLKLAEHKALHQPRRYTLSRTQLGELALHWVESWWAGLFSIVDIATYLPGSRFVNPAENHETVYSGDASAFCSTAWEWAGQSYGRSYDIWTGQKQATPFSEDRVRVYHGQTPLNESSVGDTIDDHESVEVAQWKSQRRRLPFWRQKQLALPGPNIGSDLSAMGGNVTYVVLR